MGWLTTGVPDLHASLANMYRDDFAHRPFKSRLQDKKRLLDRCAWLFRRRVLTKKMGGQESGQKW